MKKSTIIIGIIIAVVFWVFGYFVGKPKNTTDYQKIEQQEKQIERLTSLNDNLLVTIEGMAVELAKMNTESKSKSNEIKKTYKRRVVNARYINDSDSLLQSIIRLTDGLPER